jgi:hypothetical protein
LSTGLFFVVLDSYFTAEKNRLETLACKDLGRLGVAVDKQAARIVSDLEGL